MMFAVKLIKVAPLEELTGWEVFDLMGNATHVAGDYWVFEGDVEALQARVVEVVSEGATDGTGELSGSELVKHCEEIFGVDLRGEPLGWQMTTARDQLAEVKGS